MLRDDINTAVKEAMKAKDERKLSTLRMVNSTIKKRRIAARGEGKPPLSDGELLSVLQKMIKAAPGVGRTLRQGRAGPSWRPASARRSRSSPPICRSRCRTTT